MSGRTMDTGVPSGSCDRSLLHQGHHDPVDDDQHHAPAWTISEPRKMNRPLEADVLRLVPALHGVGQVRRGTLDLAVRAESTSGGRGGGRCLSGRGGCMCSDMGDRLRLVGRVLGQHRLGVASARTGTGTARPRRRPGRRRGRSSRLARQGSRCGGVRRGDHPQALHDPHDEDSQHADPARACRPCVSALSSAAGRTAAGSGPGTGLRATNRQGLGTSAHAAVDVVADVAGHVAVPLDQQLGEAGVHPQDRPAPAACCPGRSGAAGRERTSPAQRLACRRSSRPSACTGRCRWPRTRSR